MQEHQRRLLVRAPLRREKAGLNFTVGHDPVNVLVRPQTWQKDFGLGTASRCASKSEWKNKLKAEAQRRFPHLGVTLQTADALLILEWFSRTATAAQSKTISTGDVCLQPMSENNKQAKQ